jgi:tetratricopeptide (TPR) repeat protein
MAVARRRLPELGLGLCVVAGIVAAVYWPVLHAGFVWLDKLYFRDSAALRIGDDWAHLLFSRFFDWDNYFRPLVVALFALEVRWSDANPVPMHAISLGLHLSNTALVGLLADRLQRDSPGLTGVKPATCLAALAYGLHPALVEPVAWISCQFELVVTFLMLLGLLLNVLIKGVGGRALAVSGCFFLAACSKESALAFPILLLLLDAMRAAGWRAMLVRQRVTYLAVFCAGLAYLALRAWSLGFLVQPHGGVSFLAFARFQEVCLAYVSYWRILIWPMAGLSPIHEFDSSMFARTDPSLLFADVVAITLAGAGAVLAWKRHPFGYLIAGVTAALLPVLHLIPLAFDASFYHERYVMTAAAITCVLLPLALSRRIARWSIMPLAGWIILAILNIRATVPLWSDEARLWNWVLTVDPQSTTALSHLLTTYMERDDRPRAREIADALLRKKPRCALCLINVGSLAIADRDPVQARTALDLAKSVFGSNEPRSTLQAYVLATGQLRELNGDVGGAEEAYRDAVGLDDSDPAAQMSLALLLARQGRASEADNAFARALSLSAPDEREQRQREFTRARQR